jgi:D-3-phosphoglycerate dehydrogenase
VTGRVIAEAPLFPVDTVRELLDGTGLVVESIPRPWQGDDIVGVLIWQRISADDVDRLPGLRAIVTGSIGTDHIDLDATAKRGIVVANVPDYCIEEVADSTIAMLLALVRGTVALDRSVRAGQWDDHAAGPLRRLSELRLGIVGFGRIGRAVARRAMSLGIETWATDPLVPQEEMRRAGAKCVRLDELLGQCTAVTVHVPLTKATERLIGARELGLMRPGSYLINTARAGLVDMEALMAELDRNHLAGAAVDVLSVEPPTSAKPAPTHARLIVTPHAAWYSPKAEEEVVRRAALSLRAIVEGKKPEGAVLES